MACVRIRATWPTRSVSAMAGSPTGGDIVRMKRSVLATVQSLIVDCRQFSLAHAFALQQNPTSSTVDHDSNDDACPAFGRERRSTTDPDRSRSRLPVDPP